MRRAAIAILAVCALAAPSAASGVEITRHEQFRNPRTHALERFAYSVDVAPRDSDDDGFANRDDDCPHDGYTGNGGCTPEPEVSSAASPVLADGSCGGTTPYAGGGGCWAIPYYIVACESGGDYGAYNSSGAGGAYQMMGMDPSTDPATQDAAAAEMWAGGAGADNWVCY